jgi:hypothetical protein
VRGRDPPRAALLGDFAERVPDERVVPGERLEEEDPGAVAALLERAGAGEQTGRQEDGAGGRRIRAVAVEDDDLAALLAVERDLPAVLAAPSAQT